jgi:hypothetical protein
VSLVSHVFMRIDKLTSIDLIDFFECYLFDVPNGVWYMMMHVCLVMMMTTTTTTMMISRFCFDSCLD